MPLLAMIYFTKDELKLYFVGDVGSDGEARQPSLQLRYGWKDWDKVETECVVCLQCTLRVPCHL
jgi:hypothetical protein